MRVLTVNNRHPFAGDDTNYSPFLYQSRGNVFEPAVAGIIVAKENPNIQ